MLGEQRALTQHLLLFVQRSGSQHGGGQWLLSLDNHSRLWSRSREINYLENRMHRISILIGLQLYLLHGDLRLSIDVLLGVTHSCSILVLGHSPYRIGCYRSSGGGCSGTHGLGGCGSRLTDKRLANYLFNIRVQRPTASHSLYFDMLGCPLVVGSPQVAKLRCKLTNTLVGCHTRQLRGRPHGTEHLRARSRGAHGTLHVLEI